MVKTVIYKAVPGRLRQAMKYFFRGNSNSQQPISYGHEIIVGEIPSELLQGWKDSSVAKKQQTAFIPLLRKMYDGKPREDFVALATAVNMTGLEDPLIIEVGCGSGWNWEVLTHFLKRRIRYLGLDYSPSMIDLGKQCYPDARFVVGDATALPLIDDACDILISGTVLMHLLGYREAINESRRVTRKWCIFHTIPVAQKRSTTVLKKYAYGSQVVEVVFNSKEFLELIRNRGLSVRKVLDSVSHDYLSHVLGESISSRTYFCEVT